MIYDEMNYCHVFAHKKSSFKEVFQSFTSLQNEKAQLEIFFIQNSEEKNSF